MAIHFSRSIMLALSCLICIRFLSRKIFIGTIFSHISSRSSQREMIRDERSSSEITGTPQSGINQGVSTGFHPRETIILEDIDTPDCLAKQKDRTKFRSKTSMAINIFYTIPIVKFWLSLAFRLIHIILIAYSVFFWSAFTFYVIILLLFYRKSKQKIVKPWTAGFLSITLLQSIKYGFDSATSI